MNASLLSSLTATSTNGHIAGASKSQSAQENLQTGPSALVIEVVRDETALTTLEEDRLKQYLAVIGKGWQTFVEVGRAFAAIRDQKLYRGKYKTFEAFCRHEVQYHRSQVYRLIAAAELVPILSTYGDNCPKSEFQIRPLFSLSREDAATAWKRAADLAAGGEVTPRHVKSAVADLKKTRTRTRKKIKPKFGGDSSELSLTRDTLRLLEKLEEFIRTGGNPSIELKLVEAIRDNLGKLGDQKNAER